MTSRPLEGGAGKNWIYIIFVVQNWKTGEASGQNWVKSAELHRIAGQKWQVDLWVCEIHLQSRMGASGCHGSAGLQDRTMYIFLVYKLFSQRASSQVPNLAWATKLANLQCVWEPTLHSSPHGCIPGPGVYGQHVSQDFQSTGICICTTESRVVGSQEGVCGEAGVVERTSCALGGNSYWLWLQFVPWQPGSLASCFSCAECSACSCSHCILQDCIIFFS